MRVAHLAAFVVAISLMPLQSTLAQTKKSEATPPEAEGAQLMVYHKCNAFSVLSGGSLNGADGHVYVADKSLGRTPVCSVRSFKAPVGEHAIQIKDWAGLSFSFVERKARFLPGQATHVVVGKSPGGAFFWEVVSASQARELAREIASVRKN